MDVQILWKKTHNRKPEKDLTTSIINQYKRKQKKSEEYGEWWSHWPWTQKRGIQATSIQNSAKKCLYKYYLVFYLLFFLPGQKI